MISTSALFTKNFKLFVFAVLLLHLTARLYLLLSQPIGIDAATTFSYFTQHGFHTAITYYPAPNNHVLHTVLTTLVYNPGPYQTYLIRIPAFLFGLASLWLFFSITRKRFGNIPALMALAFFGAMEPVLYYSYIARGYSMLLFFSLAGVYFWMWSENFTKTWPAVFYVLMLSLGIYTIPSHLYFIFTFSAGVAFLYLGKPGFWKLLRLTFLNIAGIGIAYLAYLPIINRQGIDAIISNSYVEAKNWVSLEEWLQYFRETGEYYLLTGYGIFILGVAAIVFLVFRKRYSFLGVVSAGVLLTVLIIPVLHRTLPFQRVWIFAAPFIIWLVLEVIAQAKLFQAKAPKSLAYGVVAVAVVLSALWEYHSVQKIIAYEKGARAYKRLAQVMIEKRYSPVYLQDMYAHLLMPYHYSNSDFRDQAQVTIQGRFDLGPEDWQRLCNDYEVMVLNPSFRHDSIIGECVTDTSWANVLLTPEGCDCVMDKLW